MSPREVGKGQADLPWQLPGSKLSACPGSQNKGLELSAAFWNLSPWPAMPTCLSAPLARPRTQHCGPQFTLLWAAFPQAQCLQGTHPLPTVPHGASPPPTEFPSAPSSPTGPPIMSTVHALGSQMIFMNAERGPVPGAPSLLTSPSPASTTPPSH